MLRDICRVHFVVHSFYSIWCLNECVKQNGIKKITIISKMKINTIILRGNRFSCVTSETMVLVDLVVSTGLSSLSRSIKYVDCSGLVFILLNLSSWKWSSNNIWREFEETFPDCPSYSSSMDDTSSKLFMFNENEPFLNSKESSDFKLNWSKVNGLPHAKVKLLMVMEVT